MYEKIVESSRFCAMGYNGACDGCIFCGNSNDKDGECYQQLHKAAANAIEELSKERKAGKWIYPSDITGFGRCSKCKALWDYSLITNKYFKICPRCGSYNRGDDDV